jgi:hypothetical protein
LCHRDERRHRARVTAHRQCSSASIFASSRAKPAG